MAWAGITTIGISARRNGIKIDQVVKPTILGIRAGKDEVLESVSGCISSIGRTTKQSITATLYPNPAEETVRIRVTADRRDAVSILVTDIAGKVLYTESGNNTGTIPYEKEIDISHLNAGLYIVKINLAGGGEKTLKLTKR